MSSDCDEDFVDSDSDDEDDDEDGRERPAEAPQKMASAMQLWIKTGCFQDVAHHIRFLSLGASRREPHRRPLTLVTGRVP